jgi:two-component system nitrate/nitrite response regulator NarL
MLEKFTRRRDHSEQSRQGLARGHAAIVVDSCRLFREGLAEILKAYCFEVLTTCASVQDAMAEVQDFEPDQVELAILSLDPHRNIEPQLTAIQILRQRDPASKIVLLMPSCTTEDLVAAVLCGVDGVILKDVSAETLVATLDLVMHGQHVLPLGVATQVFAQLQEPSRGAGGGASVHALGAPAAQAALERTPSPAAEPVVRTSVFEAADAVTERASLVATRSLSLSDRETQILQCLVEGCANKLIARRLDIAEATVKVHIKGLLRKINVSNRTQAAIWALNQSVGTRTRNGIDDASVASTAGERQQAEEVAIEQALVSDVIAVFPPGGKKLAGSTRG